MQKTQSCTMNTCNFVRRVVTYEVIVVIGDAIKEMAECKFILFLQTEYLISNVNQKLLCLLMENLLNFTIYLQ